MGAGRRTYTYDADTLGNADRYNFEDLQRNLGKELAGCIFGARPMSSPWPLWETTDDVWGCARVALVRWMLDKLSRSASQGAPMRPLMSA